MTAMRRYGRQPARPVQRSMGGILDIFGGGSDSQCLDDANARVAPLDAQIANLNATWQPSGFYSPAQMDTIIGEVYALLRGASETVGKAPAGGEDAQNVRRQAVADVQRWILKGMDFVTAKNAAINQGIAIVDAPGLKRWVISAMMAASSSLVAAYTLECNVPWVISAILAYQGIFNRVAGVVKQIVGVVVSAGDMILHLPDTVSDIYPYLKWGAAAAIGIWVFMEMRKRSANNRW